LVERVVGSLMLTCRDLSFQWTRADGSAVEVLSHISFDASKGEVVAIVGPSGCGKTTLLQILAGLERPASGKVVVDGRPVVGPSRERSLVFQTPNLFPWLTLLENVAFGLQFGNGTKGNRSEKAAQAVRDIGLWEWKDQYPHQLSGGMKQRVALARALVTDPAVLLVDEPLTSVDRQTRLHLAERFLLDEVAKRQMTVLYVSHFVEEAVSIADRVLLLSARPAAIIKEYPIVLARPRDPASAAFAAIAAALLKDLEQQIARSFEDETSTQPPDRMPPALDETAATLHSEAER
jgi:NitT/TauT family transport system ATP-binding protein